MKFSSIGLTALGLLLQTVVSGQTVLPVVSSVSGSVSPGSLMTIVGTRLNDEAKLNWDPHFTTHPTAWIFGGASPTADGYGVDVGLVGGRYVSDVNLFGQQSMKFHVAGAYPDGPMGLEDFSSIDPAGGDNGEYWIRAYVRWHVSGGWPTSHIKMIMCQGANGDQYYFQPSATGDDTLPTTMSSTYDSAPHNNAIPSGRLQNDRWYSMEVHWKSTTTGGGRKFQAWVDGVLIHDGVPTSNAPTMNWLDFGIINAAGMHSGFSLDNWFGSFVVATSRIFPAVLVEIGDGPDYANANRRTQALEQISDSRVTFKLDVAGLGGGPYYLWVRNNKQQLSSGFALAGRPSSPTNVRIIR